MEEKVKQSPLVKIGIGIVIAILTGIVGLLFKGYQENQEFREEWRLDEATEELQMLTPDEKIKTLHHIEVAPTDGDFKEIQVNQRYILQEQKRMAKMDTLNADQLFQIKDELRKLNESNN